MAGLSPCEPGSANANADATPLLLAPLASVLAPSAERPTLSVPVIRSMSGTQPCLLVSSQRSGLLALR